MPLFGRRTDEDFSSEVQAHLDLETDRLIEQGMTPEAARAAARRMFGNVAHAHERFHESHRWIWIEQFGQDLRYAWRSMRASPAFVATTVVTLAVALGLLTTAFTVFNAYVLRPFAVRDPGSLHGIIWHTQGNGGSRFTWDDYEEIRRRTDLFAAAIGEDVRIVSSNVRPMMTSIVSLNYFETLEPTLLMGRALSRVDAEDAGNPAVISEPAWARIFDRDPNILGRELDLNGRHYTIVGVLGTTFTGLDDTPSDVFVPIGDMWRASEPADASARRETEITVRLRPGATRIQAETALASLLSLGSQNREPVTVELRSKTSPNPLTLTLLAALSPVIAAFALVLVAACANVSNVMLARAIARHREIAIRLAIGASRGRIVRQMLTEGLIIAVLAGLSGLAVAVWGIRLALVVIVSTLPTAVAPLARFAPMTVDSRVLLFALAVAAVTTLLFALLPALQATRLLLTDVLRGHGSIGRRGTTLRNVLVIGQVTVAIVLAITAASIARAGAAIGAMDLGFKTDGIVSINVRGTQDELARPLAERLAADPLVQDIAVTSGNPLFNVRRTISAGAIDGPALRTRLTFVSPAFFSMLRMPITAGRPFGADEARSSAPVAIVSARAARTFWLGQDPIGRTLRIERANGRSVDELPNYPEVTVIGIVPDIVGDLVINGPDRGRVYLPMTAQSSEATAILVRGRTGRLLDARTLHDLFSQVARDPEVFEVLPLEEMHVVQMYPLHAAAWIGWLLGAVALVLSVFGLYGALVYALSQRRKEIGIRIALGATARIVIGMVVRQSLRLAGVGAAIGLVLTFIALTVLTSVMRFQDVSLVDAAAFATGIALVAVATGVAAYHPARRAARVDPAQTLRADA